MRNAATAALVTMTLSSAAAIASPPPDYGLDFVTIGDAGNRAATEQEAPWLQWEPNVEAYQTPGAVDYEYRMMRSEVSVATWADFLNNYAPFHDNSVIPIGRLDSNLIPYNSVTESFRFEPFVANFGADSIGFHTAARFCNWLHNGKVNEAWAFETGAYDTSAFVKNEAGFWTDTNTRLPGAKYWVPSFDEYVKAAHYDPNKHGEGEAGYWLFPHASDDPVTPEESDIWFQYDESLPIEFVFGGPLGAFPETRSPWGLLDVSGGQPDQLESAVVDTTGQSFRIRNESRRGETSPDIWDRIDLWGGQRSAPKAFSGLRLASAIPAPGSLAVLLACLAGSAIRRRRL